MKVALGDVALRIYSLVDEQQTGAQPSRLLIVRAVMRIASEDACAPVDPPRHHAPTGPCLKSELQM